MSQKNTKVCRTNSPFFVAQAVGVRGIHGAAVAATQAEQYCHRGIFPDKLPVSYFHRPNVTCIVTYTERSTVPVFTQSYTLLDRIIILVSRSPYTLCKAHTLPTIHARYNVPTLNCSFKIVTTPTQSQDFQRNKATELLARFFFF